MLSGVESNLAHIGYIHVHILLSAFLVAFVYHV